MILFCVTSFYSAGSVPRFSFSAFPFNWEVYLDRLLSSSAIVLKHVIFLLHAVPPGHPSPAKPQSARPVLCKSGHWIPCACACVCVSVCVKLTLSVGRVPEFVYSVFCVDLCSWSTNIFLSSTSTANQDLWVCFIFLRVLSSHRPHFEFVKKALKSQWKRAITSSTHGAKSGMQSDKRSKWIHELTSRVRKASSVSM